MFFTNCEKGVDPPVLHDYVADFGRQLVSPPRNFDEFSGVQAAR